MSINKNTVRLSYNIIKGTEYSVLLQMRVFLTEQNNVMVKREELIVTTEYLLLQMRSRLNRCRGRVWLYLFFSISDVFYTLE